MSLQTIIDSVLPWCPGWEIQTGRKNLLKAAQSGLDEYYAVDDEHLIYRGTDNKGFPPYLLTTDETYRYNIEAANLSCGAITKTIGGSTVTMTAKKVVGVFVDVTTRRDDIFQTYIGRPYQYSLNPYTTSSTRIFRQDIKVNSDPEFQSGAPYVEFLNNPGTTTEKFFVEFVIGPPVLYSLSIKIPLPRRFEEGLASYIMGYVQKRESGKSNDMLVEFYDYWQPEFHRELRSCASISDDFTPQRRC